MFLAVLLSIAHNYYSDLYNIIDIYVSPYLFPLYKVTKDLISVLLYLLEGHNQIKIGKSQADSILLHIVVNLVEFPDMCNTIYIPRA